MLNFKRILALLLCVCMIPMSGMVNADSLENTLVSIYEDTSTYTELSSVGNFTLYETPYTQFEFADDGYLQLKHTASQELNSAESAAVTIINDYFYYAMDGIVAEDEVNQTNIYADMLKGKYQIVIDYEALMLYNANVKNSAGTTIKLNSPYYSMVFEMNGSDEGFFTRMLPTLSRHMSKNSQSTSIGDISADIRKASTDRNHTLTYIYDTDSGEIQVYSNEDTATVLSGNVSVPGPLSGIKFDGLSRILEDSYFKIKNIEVTQLRAPSSVELDAILEELPDKLADNINDVDADIALPAVEGVTWSTSDENVISNTGKVTRKKGVAQVVVITATFKADEITYKKNYAMTVAPGDNNVVFVDEDGKELAVQQVRDGNVASSISAPLKPGHTFAYWYIEDENIAYDFTTPVYGDLKLYPKYTVDEYTVTFMVDGEKKFERTAVYGSAIDGNLPEIPEKINYTAVGWVIEGTDEIFTETSIVKGNMTVNATYQVGNLKKYTVTFLSDGVTLDTQEVWEGYAVSAPAQSPEKENYVFAYWMYNGSKYDFDTVVDKDITLTAYFEPKEFDVNFYNDDKVSLLHNAKGYYGKAFGILPENPQKEGFKFVGWKVEDGTVFDENSIITGKTTVYAEFESLIKVVVDEDYTKSVNTTDGNWTKASNTHGELMLDPEGGIRLEQVISTPLSGGDYNRNTEKILKKDFEIIVDEDAENRSVVKNKRFIGVYDLELALQILVNAPVYPSDYTGTKPGNYPLLSVGTSSGSAASAFEQGPLSFRLYTATIQALNTSSTSTASINKSYTISKGTVNTIKLRINTYDNTVKTWINDDEKNAVEGVWMVNKPYFDSIQLITQQRMGVGSYVTFKNAKITQREIDESSESYVKCMEILDLLPNTLSTEDPYHITENLTLPSIEGVTWQTSDADTIDAKGNITRGVTNQDVVITANVSVGDYLYVKEYTVTVLKNESVVEKERYSASFENDTDLDDWTFIPSGDLNTVKYSVGEYGIKFIKNVPSQNPEATSTSREYTAFLDFYEDVKANVAARDYKGVIDVSFDSIANITSQAPAKVMIGWREKGQFYSPLSLDYTKDGINFVFDTSSEMKSSKTVSVKNEELANVTLRVDTVNNKAWIFYNGTQVGKSFCSFYNPVNGSEFMINSLCVVVDKNNDLNDYVSINNVKVKSYNEASFESTEKAIAASDDITIDMIAYNPQALEGKLKALPQKLSNGYNVEWKCTTDQIDLQTLEIFHKATETDAVIYAYISNPDESISSVVRKAFPVTIREAKNAEEIAKYDINLLGTITNQPYDDVRYDLTLPAVEGVIWTSSNTDVISNEGKLNKNNVLTSDTDVVFTASKDGVTKNYPLTVSKYTKTEELLTITGKGNLKFDKNGYSDIVISGDSLVNFKFTENGKDNKLELVSSDGNKIVGAVISGGKIFFEYKNSPQKLYDLNVSTENTVEFKVMPDVGFSAIYLNGVLVEDYVQFVNAADGLAGVNVSADMSAPKVTVNCDEYTLVKLDVDNIPYFDGLSNKYLTDNVELKTESVTNNNVTWATSNNSIVTNTGVVSMPEKLEFVDLTFKVTSSKNADIYYETVKTVAVDCKAENNKAFGSKADSNALEHISYPFKNMTDNDISTYAVISSASDSSKYVSLAFDKNTFFNAIYVNEDSSSLKTYVVEISNDGKVWEKVKEGTFTDVKSSLITFDKIYSTKNIRLVFGKTSAKNVNIREFKVYLFADKNDYAEIDVESVELGITSTDKDVVLPANGANGTELIWNSSNEEVISSTGKFKQPLENITVTLTVSAVNTTKTKSFEIFVKGSKGFTGPSVIAPGGSSGGSGGGGGGGASMSGTSVINPVVPGDTYKGEVTDDETNNNESKKTTYADVSADAWYAEYVEKLSEIGVVNGDENGNFNPQDNVTREQFVKMIVVACGLELSDSKSEFDDVDENAWFAPYVVTAQENNIVNGITDKDFGVGVEISRQDMACIIARYLESKGFKLDESEDKFTDDFTISDYANSSIYKIKHLGIINGYEGNFNPKNNLTRAEASKVICTLFEFINK